MLSFEEVKNFGKKEIKKKPSEREKLLGNVDPVKEALYLKWKETQPKTAGGTVNPIISTDWKVNGNRNLEGRKSQTYAQALAANRAKAGTLGANVPEGVKPSDNIREMIFGTAKRGGTINPAISAADFSTRYDQMTDRENAIFSYYKKAGQEKQAEDFLKAIDMDMNRRAAEKRTADARKLAEESTVGGLYARYMAGLTSPMGALYGAVQEGRGEAIDANSPLFMGEQIRQGQTEGFVGESTGLKKAAKEAALGAFDWGTQVATLGAMGLSGAGLGAGNSALYGASAFGGNVKDATERGATASEAVTYGAIGAAAEIITEKMGFERLFQLGKLAKGRKGALAKEILRNMGAEGLEEGTTEAVNLIADALILGDRSQMAGVYSAAKAHGMTEGQAAKEALLTAAKQIGYSGGVGALSGGLIAGGVAGLSRGLGRNALGETAVTEKTSESGTVDGVSKPVENVGEKPKNVGEMQKNVGEMQKNVGEMQKNGAKSSNDAGKMKETVKTTAETAAEYGDKYFQEEGQKLFIAEAEKRGNVSFLPAFQTYYFAGNRGVLEKDIRQTAYTEGADRGLLTAAYMAGTKDRLADIEQRKANAGKAMQTVGVFGAVEKLTEGQKNYLEAISDVLGIEIQVEETASYNGKYANGRMHIAADAETFAGTVSHEMGHIIRQVAPESYAEIEQMVFTKLEKMDGKSFDQRLAEYDAKLNRFDGENTEGRGGYDEYALMEEMVCDGLQAIVQSEADAAEFFRSMEQQKPGILQKLKEFLENMLQKLQGLIGKEKYKEIAKDLRQDEAFVKELRDKVAKAAAEAGQTESKKQAVEQADKAKYLLNEKFPDQYDAWDGKKYTAFHIGKTSEALKDIGIETKNIIWHSEKIRKIKKKHNGMTDKVIKQVPKILENPIIVMKSSLENTSGETSRITIFGEVNDANGMPVLAVLELQPKNKNDVILDFQVIASAYGKTTKIKNFIENSEILYLDKNKNRTDTWLKSFGLQLPSGITEYGSIGSVTYGENGVKIEGVTYKQLLKKKNGKFSLKEPVEETKDLIALHNLSAESFTEALKLGGFPMPSIAIVKDKMGHEKYGEISVVFGKDTIDPEADSRNAVFGGDGWTPTRPRVEYPVDYDRKTEIEDGLEGLAKKVANGIFARASILSSLGVEDGTGMNRRDIAEKLAGQDMVRAAYLAEQGKDIDPVYQEKKYDRYGNEFLQKIIDRFGEQELAKKAVKLNLGEELNDDEIFAVREIWKQNWIDSLPEGMKRKRTPEQIAEKAEENAEKKVQSYEAGKFILHAWEMYEDGGGVSEEIDRLATSDRLQEETNYKEVADWAEGKLDGLLGEPGIYNGKDPYTVSGNRRSFNQLHYPYTLENIVKAMSETQKERGEGLWGLTASGLQSVAVAEYGSIEEIRADRGRLRMEGEEAYREALNALDQKIEEVLQKIRNTTEAHSSNPYIESDIIGGIIIEAAAKGKQTAQSVKRLFAKEGYRISDSIAKEIVGMFEDAARIPTGYFEAKPKRAVGLDEILYVVLPDNADTELKKELEARGIPVEEYEYGNSESRLQAVNSRENVKFSIRGDEYELMMEEKEELKGTNAVLKKEILLLGDALTEEKNVKRAIRKWKYMYGGTFDTAEQTKKIMGLLQFAVEKGAVADTREIMAATCGMAEEMLHNSSKRNTRAKEAYKGLWDKIRKTKIKVSKKMAEELEIYGGYNTFRMEYFGRMPLSMKEGQDIALLYQELREQYPDFFSEAENHTEMLLQIGAVMDILRPTVDNPYGYDMKGYAMDAAYELWDTILEGAEVSEEQKEAFVSLQNDFHARIEKRRSEAREREERLLSDITEKTDGRTIEQQKEWTRTQRAYYVEKLNKKTEEYKNRREHQIYAKHRRQIDRDTKAILKWIAKPTNKYHVPKRYLESLSALLVKLDSNNKEITLLQSDIQRMLSALKETSPNGENKGVYVNCEYDAEIEKYLQKLATVIDRSGGKIRLAELTNLQIDWLRRTIAGLRKGLTEANRMHGAKANAALDEFSRNFIKEAEGRKKAAEEGPLRVLGDFMGISMLTPETFLKGVSQEVYNTFWNGYSEGMAKKTLHTEEARAFMNNLVSVKDARKWDSEAPRKIEVSRNDGSKMELYMTTPQIMYLYCAMRRHQAMLHLVGGMVETEKGWEQVTGSGFTIEPEWKLRLKGRKEMEAALKQAELFRLEEAELRQITNLLTEEQRKVAEGIQEFLSTTVAEWGNETSREMYGYDKFKEEFYIPITSNEYYLTAVFGREGENNRTLQNMGAAKSTNDYANNPIVISNIFDVFSRHIDQMTSYNAFVPILSDTNKFLNYKELPKAENIGLSEEEKAAVLETMTQEEAEEWNKAMGEVAENIRKESEIDIAETFGEKGEAKTVKVASVRTSLKTILGPKAEEYFNKLMIDINNAAGTDDTGKFSKMMLRNMKVSSVGANLRVAIQQPISIVRAMAVINPVYLLEAPFAGRNDWKRIYQTSPIALWKEWGGAEMDTGRTLREMITGQSLYQKITGMSMVPAGWLDKLTWGRIWKACELETKKKHPELQGDRFYETVGKRFDEIIDRTQVVDSVLHRSENMRSKNFFLKMTTSFMSEPIKTYNMAYDAVRDVLRDRKSKEAWNKLARTSFTLVLNGIMVAIAAGFVDALRDDDDEDKFREKWKNAVIGDYSEAETGKDKLFAFWASNLNDNLNLMNTMPLLKDIYSLISGYDVVRTDFSGISDIINCLRTWMKYMEGDKKYTLKAMLSYTAGQFSKAFGIPYKSLERDIFAVKDSVINHLLGIEAVQSTIGLSDSELRELQYGNKKIKLNIGSEKNLKTYTKMMLEAEFNGDTALATKIYNEMIAGGIDNDTMEAQIESREREKIKKEKLAEEAIEAYNRKDYDTYTAKMDELSEKGYLQKNIEKTLSSMFKEKYGEEKAKTFEEITAEIWAEEEEMEKEKFQSVINGLVEAKTSGRNSEATRLFNYMVNRGLDNDSIRSGINSAEKKFMKEDALTVDGAEAYHVGDVDGFLRAVDGLQAKKYFTENIYEAIKAKHEELYGEDDPGVYEKITDDYWVEEQDDTGAEYGLLFNAWKNGSNSDYERIWDILLESGKKNGSIRSSMKNRLREEYWKATDAGDTGRAKRAYNEFRALGGKHETIMKRPD